MGDATALDSKVVAPDIEAVAPATSESESLVAGTTNWTTTVVGSDPSWLTVRGRSMTEGRFIDDQDLGHPGRGRGARGHDGAELFGVRDPVGQSVDVAGQPDDGDRRPRTAVGSSSARRPCRPRRPGRRPLTTASALLFGGTSRNSVSQILIQATSSGTLSAAYQEADAELLSLHGITTTSGADFTITSEQQVLSTATSVDRTLTVLLGGIAGISLLVGGIGVMNIMLVSVTERIREIGLRKALGATPRVIRRQFLVEASVLGSVGGILGAVLGVIGALVLPHLISNPITVSPAAAVGAIVIAVAIGIVFGVYPAGRAAKLPAHRRPPQRVTPARDRPISDPYRPPPTRTTKEATMHDHNPTTTTGPAPAASRRTRSRTVAALSVVGVAGLAFAACGGSSGASTTPTTAARPSGSTAPRTTLPGATGTIAAVNGTTLEVQNTQTGQTTVAYTPTTTIRQISTTSAATVVVGSCISAFGKPTTASTSSAAAFDEPITATTVSITQPTNGTCSRGGFGAGGPGGTPGTGSRPAGGFGGYGGGTPGSGSRPAGSFGGGSFRGGSFGAATGQVTAVSGSVVTVSGTDPRTQKATTVTVTLTGTTTFTTTATATPAAIAVGQCARAVGTAGTTGAITATSLTLSQPTNGTCTSGFGFRGGFGGAPGGAGGATTSA